MLNVKKSKACVMQFIMHDIISGLSIIYKVASTSQLN